MKLQGARTGTCLMARKTEALCGLITSPTFGILISNLFALVYCNTFERSDAAMGAVLAKILGCLGNKVNCKPSPLLQLPLSYSSDISAHETTPHACKPADLSAACPARPDFNLASPVSMQPSSLTAFVIGTRPLAVLIQNFLKPQECQASSKFLKSEKLPRISPAFMHSISPDDLFCPLSRTLCL